MTTKDPVSDSDEPNYVVVAIRAGVALFVGLLCGLLAAKFSHTDVWADILAGWIAGGLVFVAWTWIVILPMDGERTRSHARQEDATQLATVLFIVAASLLSLIAVGCLIRSGSRSGLDALQEAAVGVASIVVGWFAVHSIFTTHYGRLYYSGSAGGIDFNQKADPRYTDFAYVAFTIGMAYAVSDTNLKDSSIRRVALAHAMVSYLFGAVILAATINLLVGGPG